MKYLLIVQMLIGLFMIVNDAQASGLSCHASDQANTYLCESSDGQFEFKGVRDQSVMDQFVKHFENPFYHPLCTNSIDINAHLKGLIYTEKKPANGNWKLPLVTLLILKNKGIQHIHGYPINALMGMSEAINWNAYSKFSKHDRFSVDRYTGRFNRNKQKVTFLSADLKGHDFSDLEQWGLHEVLGIAGINDTNYEVSTFAIMVSDNFLTAEEFHDFQYIVPKSTHTIPFIFSPTFKNYFHKSGTGDDDGGVTGVEGGGDIVSASIKRFMLMSLALGPKQIDKAKKEQVKTVIDYDIGYSTLPIHMYLNHTSPLLKSAKPVSVEFYQETVKLIVPFFIREKWQKFSFQEKIKIGQSYVQYIREVQEGYLL